MDWLFDPLARFFEWSFTILQKLNMGFNWFLIVGSGALTLWWMWQMWKHPKERY